MPVQGGGIHDNTSFRNGGRGGCGDAHTRAGIELAGIGGRGGKREDAGAGLCRAAQPLVHGTVATLAPVVDVAYARAIGSLGDRRSANMLGAPVAATGNGIGRDIARLSRIAALRSITGAKRNR